MEVHFCSNTRHVNPEVGYTMRKVYSSEKFILHYHDYYEFFLAMSDGVCHVVNGQQQILPAQSLVFIRPEDTHFYKKEGKDFSFVNIAFSSDTMDKLCAYYGRAADRIRESKMPPTILLKDSDYNYIMQRLDSLNTVDLQDTETKRTKMKMILTEIFLYFIDNQIEKSEHTLPLWLSDLTIFLKQTDNMDMTLADMAQKTGMTREHITRSFQKYFNTTATGFMLDQKLNYGANLLLNTDLSILDICYECGFQTPCWFYRKFKEKFGVTPKEFRTQAGS